MSDKMKDLEMRMDRIENRLKATFLEIERKFEENKLDQPIVTNFNERMQELEDLLLLLQLEITKLKEKTGVDVDFGTTPAPQRDIDERLRKLEESATGDEPVEREERTERAEPYMHDSGKVERLESIVLEMKENIEKSHLDYKNASSVRHELDDLERRLSRLETKPVAHATSQPQSGRVLADVRRILES